MSSTEVRPTRSRFVPYPALEHHGVIGDRRTSALVAADGTVNWLCLPDFDSGIVFGALLDWSKGGHWRLAPSRLALGAQEYLPDSMVLQTRWNFSEGAIVLYDAMLWPESRRVPGQEDARVLVRVLRCVRGQVRCEMDLQASCNFQAPAASFTKDASGLALALPELKLRVITSQPAVALGPRVHRAFDLSAGEEFWAVLESGSAEHNWSCDTVRSSLDQTRRYWADWLGGIRPLGQAVAELRRAAMAVHLLTYAPEGSVVAAPTTSVPERIGGDWNVDYRLSWVRDASLSVSMLARLGNLRETEQYLNWMAHRLSEVGRPLQVLYGIRGEKKPVQRKLPKVAGYRDSQPVRVGNHAYKQHQLGSYGYLADCIRIYLQEGGLWQDDYWMLIHRLATYTTKHWQNPENGIWELPHRRHYVVSKVLSWVTIDRAVKIARQYRPGFDTSYWEKTAAAIHAEVMERGWSERLGAFRQHYDAETLDAAALLIPLMEFLPGDHPRVRATLDRIADNLTINGFVFRFDPLLTPGLGQLPLGELEGAFLPSTFWLATAYAKSGQPDRAEALLQRAAQIAGPLGLFSEAVDPRSETLLGNTPLLFSLVEYVRAWLEIARVRAEGPGSPRVAAAEQG